MDCFIFEIQRTLYSNNRNYVLTYVEKPLYFDPFGQTEFTPLAII